MMMLPSGGFSRLLWQNAGNVRSDYQEGYEQYDILFGAYDRGLLQEWTLFRFKSIPWC